MCRSSLTLCIEVVLVFMSSGFVVENRENNEDISILRTILEQGVQGAHWVLWCAGRL